MTRASSVVKRQSIQTRSVARRLPGRDLSLQGRLVGQPLALGRRERRRRDAPATRSATAYAGLLQDLTTVSYETAWNTSKATSRCASSPSVQRLRPWGGALQVSATRWASCSPSSLRRYWRSGALRSHGDLRPAVGVLLAHPDHGGVVDLQRGGDRRSIQPGPASPWLALSRMRAWVRARTGAVPGRSGCGVGRARARTRPRPDPCACLAAQSAGSLTAGA